MALLSTWLSLEPLYLVQLCIYTGATHREKILHLQIIFLKLWILKKNNILHFLAHIHAKDTNPNPHLLLCTWWHNAGASGVYSFYIHLKYVFVNPSQLKGIWAQRASVIIYLAHLVMSLCFVWCLSLVLSASTTSASSVYSCPSNSFDHRDFISYKYMGIFP